MRRILRSMLPFRLIYHDDYDLHLGNHVFPSCKYSILRQHFLAEGFALSGDFVEPVPANDSELLLVHTAGWIEKLKNGALTDDDIHRLEIPYSPKTMEAFCLAAGGTTLAGRLALRAGISFNVGGGFHHAFPEHGEGFCAINDVAVAIRTLQRYGCIETAMVVDCDVHQGNGTAAIFAGDHSVFTLSIHQGNGYPDSMPPSDIDIHLPDGARDADYCSRLAEELRLAFSRFRANLLVYIAGADPYYQDQLGALNLTFAGLWERDWLVMETALRCGTAVAVTLGGGYARQLLDTITIHMNTAKVGKQVLEKVGWPQSVA